MIFLVEMLCRRVVAIFFIATSLQLSSCASFQIFNSEHRGRHNWLASLSQEDQMKIRALRARAMQDPAVQAARQKKERANKEYRDALRAAMLKLEPSVKPILEKIPEPKKRNDS
jgi:hypothetical protein